MIGQQMPHDDVKAAFIARHHDFASKYYERLMTTINAANGRVVQGEPIIFYLGIRVARDFEAILLLVWHDMAIPAQSLLRGMFERTVNLVYLHAHPEELACFGEFDFVQRRKLWKAIRDVTGRDPVDDEESLAELERNYQRVKDRYTRSCKCGEPTGMVSWSKLDTVAMAKQLPALAPLLVEAYHRPLLQAHSTLQSMIAGMQVVDDQLRFDPDTTELSDCVFYVAHALMMITLETELAHFPSDALAQTLLASRLDFQAMYATTNE